ncbi:MAG: DNA alkylation repair protein [bacterium]|nr:DNA alkylation repair protein [bacterium]
MDGILKIERELNLLRNPAKAKILSRFFKTDSGQYGEGDMFLGLTVPMVRGIAKKYTSLTLLDLQKLLNSKIHEYRLSALLILIDKYKKTEDQERKKIFNFYLKNAKNINNWDLVDLSAPNVVGSFLQEKDKSILRRLAKSNNLWKKRIAILATYQFIRHNNFEETINIAEILLSDKHDLIHKSVGWMLREVGKRDQNLLEEFLDKHLREMSRTMLRYAIEKFPEEKRRLYLNKKT